LNNFLAGFSSLFGDKQLVNSLLNTPLSTVMNRKLITPKNKNSFFDKAYPVWKSNRDFSKDPFFVKKAEMAHEFLLKHGLPKELTSKH